MIDINATATELVPKCMQLLAVHALTGYDTVNFPYGKGKSSAVSTLLNHQTELDMMGEEEAEMLPVIADAHEFMLLLYKKNRPTGFMNELRYSMFSQKKDSSIKTLPATDPVLHEHINGHTFRPCFGNQLIKRTPLWSAWRMTWLTCRGRWSAKAITWH